MARIATAKANKQKANNVFHDHENVPFGFDRLGWSSIMKSLWASWRTKVADDDDDSIMETGMLVILYLPQHLYPWFARARHCSSWDAAYFGVRLVSAARFFLSRDIFKMFTARFFQSRDEL